VSTGGFIDELTAQIYDSVLADIKLWGTRRNTVFRTFNTYLGENANTAIGYLKNYMKVRAKAIADYYADDSQPTWTIDGHTLVIDGNGCADENLADQTLWQEKSDELYEVSVGGGINAVDLDLFSKLDHLTVINVKGKDTLILGGDSLCRDVILCGKTGSEVQRFASLNGYSFVSAVNCAHLLRSHIDATDPTEEGPGNSEYWACDSCGKYFSDGRCIHEIQKDSWIIPALPKESGTETTSVTETSISTEPGTTEEPSGPAVTQKMFLYTTAIGGGIIIVILIVLGIVLKKKKKAR
ncbi:MAG: hypothetical protein KBS76_05630, partial [Ruminococcus sp.]|nr:hypothetical protein [Candidatus Apopatosoma intestinale]